MSGLRSGAIGQAVPGFCPAADSGICRTPSVHSASTTRTSTDNRLTCTNRGRPGAERLMDLVVVCPGCHDLIHTIFIRGSSHMGTRGTLVRHEEGPETRTIEVPEYREFLPEARQRYVEEIFRQEGLPTPPA